MQSPAVDCRRAAKSLLRIKQKISGRNRLLWKWIKGEATSQADFGDPIHTTTYAFRLFASGTLVAEANVPASTANWTAIGTKGFRYKDRAASNDGIQTILLKGSDANKAKALLKGKGANLPDLDLGALPLPIVAQLVNLESGRCWEGTYDAGGIIKNESDEFRAEAFNQSGVCGNGEAEFGEECDLPDDDACPGRCAAPGEPDACQCIRPLSCADVTQPPDSCSSDTDCPVPYNCTEGECHAASCVVKADCTAGGQCVHVGTSAEGTCVCRGCGPWDCGLGCAIGGLGVFDGCLCNVEEDCPPEDDVCFLGVCS